MKKLKRKIKVIIEKTDTGFSAYAQNYNAFTTGKTISELHSNMLEALNLFFQDQNIKILNDNIELKIDLKQFFQYYRVINSKYLAERIGMNPTLLSQYVQGRKIPSELQINKIISGIQQIGKELSQIHFTS